MNTSIYEAATLVATPIYSICQEGTTRVAMYIERIPRIIDDFMNAYRREQGSSRANLLPRTIRVLRENSLLGSQAVSEYCEYLSTVYPRFSYLKSLLFTIQSVNELVSQIKKIEGVIHIPIILERELLREHVVVFTLDRSARIVEYYDPFGTPLENQTRKVVGVYLPANQFIRQLIRELETGEWKIDSNQTQHQFDFHNCGVHICWYMEKRQNMTFKEIKASTGVEPAKYRAHMAARLEGLDLEGDDSWEVV